MVCTPKVDKILSISNRSAAVVHESRIQIHPINIGITF